MGYCDFYGGDWHRVTLNPTLGDTGEECYVGRKLRLGFERLGAFGVLNFRGLLRHIVCLILVVLWPIQVLAAEGVPLRDMPVPPREKRYPIKNDPITIKEAYSNSEQWDGRAVAVEGTVISVETNARGQPSIELALGSIGDTTIWATWALVNTDGMRSFLHVGEKLRVLGWMRDTIAWSKVTHLDLPRQNPLTLLPICLVKVRNLDAVFDSKFIEYCEAWLKGYMPPDLAG